MTGTELDRGTADFHGVEPETGNQIALGGGGPDDLSHGGNGRLVAEGHLECDTILRVL